MAASSKAAGMSFVLDHETQHKLLTVASNQDLQRDLNLSMAAHNDDVDRLEGEKQNLVFDFDNEQYHVGELEESINNLVADKTTLDMVAHGWEARVESMEAETKQQLTWLLLYGRRG